MPLPAVFSQRTVEATLLASFAVLAVCLAGLTETPSNNEQQNEAMMEGAGAVMGNSTTSSEYYEIFCTAAIAMRFADQSLVVLRFLMTLSLRPQNVQPIC